MVLLLLIPAGALAFSALGFIGLMLRQLGVGCASRAAYFAFWATNTAAGAIALSLIATGRSA